MTPDDGGNEPAPTRAGMAGIDGIDRVARTFKSAVDWWFYASIGLTVVVLTFASFQMWIAGSTLGLAVVVGTTIIAVGLPVWLLKSTCYVVEASVLRIRCGPFSWNILRSSIENIEPSRSPLSSPALSLNRLKIRYDAGQSVMVSPSAQDEFLEAMQRPPDV